MSDSLRPCRLLCPWDSPGKNTEVGCHALIQGIFPPQGANLHLLHWQAGSFNTSTTWEVLMGARHVENLSCCGWGSSVVSAWGSLLTCGAFWDAKVSGDPQDIRLHCAPGWSAPGRSGPGPSGPGCAGPLGAQAALIHSEPRGSQAWAQRRVLAIPHAFTLPADGGYDTWFTTCHWSSKFWLMTGKPEKFRVWLWFKWAPRSSDT